MKVKTGSEILILHLVLVLYINGVISSGDIILDSIQIFNTHEWLAPKPTVYFYCQGENKTVLPDVKEKHFVYNFKGHESWQPLTELPDKKCKRCGLYEMDEVKTDDIFDEWEFCRDDFVDGNYVHYKEKEFNATFACPECITPAITIGTSIPKRGASEKKSNVILAVFVGVLVSAVVVAVMMVVHKYWTKRKREHDQARFLKLFEETDDLDDELDNF